MDAHKTWTQILEKIKPQISTANFRAWLSPVIISEVTPDKIVLLVRDAFIKGQLLSRYDPLIKTSASEIIGHETTVEYIVDPSLFEKKAEEKRSEENILDEEFFKPSLAQNLPFAGGLNPKYALENFVVGLTNNLAFAAAQAVVQNPGTTYNPLFIYGPSGVGKTHLMHAIGNAVLAKNNYAKLIYATSERFMNDLVDSIQNRKTGEFRNRYRNCNLLLIDDVQFISGKDSTQEEFFHTFNELSSKNAQIVLTSDRPPNEMQRLESRLLSRFQGGLMVDIQLPDFDTRMAILKAKLHERGDTLPEDSLKLIAESVESNTRELEGKLISILQSLKLQNLPPTTEFVQQQLGKTQTSQAFKSFDYKKVLNTINQYFSIKMADLTGPRRQKQLVLPRQIAMYILYEDCHLPMEKVGEILGGRDHTTVLHGVEKIRNIINRDREIQRTIMELKQLLSP